MAQVPNDSLPGQDTTRQILDSLQQQIPSPFQDSLLLKQDSIYNTNETTNQDTTTSAADTVRTKRKKEEQVKKTLVSDSAIANGFGIYLDYLKFASQLLSEDIKYEGGLEITLSRRFKVVGEAGYGLLKPESAIRNGTYQSEGNYWRGGLDYTLIADANNYFYIGGRFAQSNFQDQGAYQIESPLWPNEAKTIETRKNQAQWYEFILGTEGRLFADLYLGWIFRYRLMISRDSYDLLDVYSVPGFGIATGDSSLAVNFILKYKFHW